MLIIDPPATAGGTDIAPSSTPDFEAKLCVFFGKRKEGADSSHECLLENSFGGAEGDRTPDLMTASHALSQLSYGPMWCDAD